MLILITAGNTQTPIDDVRVITNVFSGRTGLLIAQEAYARGHSVCLLTSHPEGAIPPPPLEKARQSDAAVEDTVRPFGAPSWDVTPYRTFDDLQSLLEQTICGLPIDAIVHSAAVSDYQMAGTYAPANDVEFDPSQQAWRRKSGTEISAVSATASPATSHVGDAGPIQMVDVSAGKVKSSHRELWMRLIPTPKLIDQIREPWGFRGLLVKFKLEVGLNDAELIRIAEASRVHSRADVMVANTYSEMRKCAFLGPINGAYQRLERVELPNRLLDLLEASINS